MCVLLVMVVVAVVVAARPQLLQLRAPQSLRLYFHLSRNPNTHTDAIET